MLERPGTVVIVGVGLIGGSIGLALRTRGLAGRVIGVGRSQSSLSQALEFGAVDEVTSDLDKAVASADIAVLCTPVTEIASGAIRAAAAGPSRLLVTDAGSTKRTIVEAVERDEKARRTFVAAHPIAGSEKKGPGAATAGLFDGRACVLTPTKLTPPDRLERARGFWAGIGCQIHELDPTAHDEALALTSHLPHAVAAALAASIPAEMLPLAAGAYRDGTRVAGSTGSLWAGIFHENREPLLSALDRFESHLREFRRALESGDEVKLEAWWEIGRALRALYAERPVAGTVED